MQDGEQKIRAGSLRWSASPACETLSFYCSGEITLVTAYRVHFLSCERSFRFV